MPKVVDHDSYREELLNKATPLFLEHGYDGLRTRELARRLGVSTGTLYHYFPSKDALFEAVVCRQMGRDIEAIRRFFLEIPSRAGRVRAIADFLEGNRELFDAQNQLCFHYVHKRQQEGADMSVFLDDIYEGWLQMSRELLELRSTFALDLLGQVIDGFFMQWMQGSRSPDLREFFAGLSRWLPRIDDEEWERAQSGSI